MYASVISSTLIDAFGLSMTSFTGMPYFFAKAKSLVSWAGTAMMAPVPYSIRTKFPTNRGTVSPVKGFTMVRPVSIPSFSFSSDIRSLRDCALKRSMKSRTAGIVTRSSSGCSGAITMKVTPYTVSGLVVYMGKSSPDESLKLIFRPVERPIQFLCMVMTCSGHPAASSSWPDRSRSAYAVILKNHWSSSFWVTSFSQRQHTPFSACSFARTVWHEGHQLTDDTFLYASPFS